jgi:hypothetical protein
LRLAGRLSHDGIGNRLRAAFIGITSATGSVTLSGARDPGTVSTLCKNWER